MGCELCAKTPSCCKHQLRGQEWVRSGGGCRQVEGCTSGKIGPCHIHEGCGIGEEGAVDRGWRRWEGETRKVEVRVKVPVGSVCFGKYRNPRKIPAPHSNVGWGILFFDPSLCPIQASALLGPCFHTFQGPNFASPS